MEKLVVILDAMPEYANRLALYLNGSREFPYRAVVPADAEEAKEYRNRDAIYAILAAEQLEREVLEIAAGTGIRLFWLGESKRDRSGSVLFRYTSAKEIEKLFYEKETSEKKIPVLGFYSPAGGCEAELLSRKIAVELGKRGKLLYLPFFPFGIYGREERDGLSEAIFFIRQKEVRLREQLQGLLQRGDCMDSLGPLRWSTELTSVTKEDVTELLSPENWETEYGAYFIAVGQWDRTGRELLQLCDRIFVPVWGQEEGRRLQEEFRRQLKESGETRLYSGLLEFEVSDPLPENMETAIRNAVGKGGMLFGEGPGGDSQKDIGTPGFIGGIDR